MTYNHPIDICSVHNEGKIVELAFEILCLQDTKEILQNFCPQKTWQDFPALLKLIKKQGFKCGKLCKIWKRRGKLETSVFQISTAFILNNLSKILGKSDKEISLGLASFFGASHGIYASSFKDIVTRKRPSGIMYTCVPFYILSLVPK